LRYYAEVDTTFNETYQIYIHALIDRGKAFVSPMVKVKVAAPPIPETPVIIPV
jgi:hypothetical protein